MLGGELGAPGRGAGTQDRGPRGRFAEFAGLPGRLRRRAGR